jgi:serine/threonine protein phosphatase PrpC
MVVVVVIVGLPASSRRRSPIQILAGRRGNFWRDELSLACGWTAHRPSVQLVCLTQIMSNGLIHVTKVVGMRGAGQDRAGVQEVGDSVVIALADGAGGTGGGSKAAQAVVDAVFAAASQGPAWPGLLAELDRDAVRLGGGQTTAIVLSVTRTGIAGAAVGDSGAWVIRNTAIEDLTAGQLRKPLLGAGCVPFVVRGRSLEGGTLLVASDGLINYASQASIARIASGEDLASAAHSLVDLVRLRSGALQDDVSIVLCRQAT